MSEIFKQWIYHLTEEPKIIMSNEFDDYEEDGWSDTPATFVKIQDFGVDAGEDEKIQGLGEAIEGVKDRLNGELNIGKMGKEQLAEHALEHHNITLDLEKGVRALRNEVKELVGE